MQIRPRSHDDVIDVRAGKRRPHIVDCGARKKLDTCYIELMLHVVATMTSVRPSSSTLFVMLILLRLIAA